MSQEAYEIEALIGRGRFGLVYRAAGPDGPVALKKANTEWDMVHRDQKHAENLRQLEVPGLVCPDRWLFFNGVHWAVLPLVPGISVSQVVEPMPVGAALQLVAALADILRVLRGRTGFQPWPPAFRLEHVRVADDGSVRVVDLWHCHLNRDDPADAVWLAPERVRSPDVASPSDEIYGLGLFLHGLLGGEPMDRAETHMGRHAVQLSLALDSLSDVGIHDDVVGLVSDMLAFEPTGRPSLSQIAEESRDIASELGGADLAAWALDAVPAVLAELDFGLDSRIGSRVPVHTPASIVPAADKAPDLDPFAPKPTPLADLLAPPAPSTDLPEESTASQPPAATLSIPPVAVPTALQGNSDLAMEQEPISAPSESDIPDADALDSEEEELVAPPLIATPSLQELPSERPAAPVPPWAIAAGVLVLVFLVFLGVSGGGGEDSEPAPATLPSAEAPAPAPSPSPAEAATPQPQPSAIDATVPPEPAADEAPTPVPDAVPERAPTPSPSPPRPAPTAEPEPAVAAAAPPPRTDVTVTGDEAKVWLVRNGRRFALPGPIEAGDYSVEASFGGADAAPAGSLRVPESGTLVVTCNALFARCSVEN